MPRASELSRTGLEKLVCLGKHPAKTNAAVRANLTLATRQKAEHPAFPLRSFVRLRRGGGGGGRGGEGGVVGDNE